LKDTFVVVQDHLFDETAALADVVFPAASLYEKSGTVTNTYGDVATGEESIRSRRRQAGLRDPRSPRRQHGRGCEDRWFPSAKAASRADLGQSRGVHSGEADRHSVWLAAHNLEPKLSPFDPLCAAG